MDLFPDKTYPHWFVVRRYFLIIHILSDALLMRDHNNTIHVFWMVCNPPAFYKFRRCNEGDPVTKGAKKSVYLSKMVLPLFLINTVFAAGAVVQTGLGVIFQHVRVDTAGIEVMEIIPDRNILDFFKHPL